LRFTRERELLLLVAALDRPTLMDSRNFLCSSASQSGWLCLD
jgi:hypothetical protein